MKFSWGQRDATGERNRPVETRFAVCCMNVRKMEAGSIFSLPQKWLSTILELGNPMSAVRAYCLWIILARMAALGRKPPHRALNPALRSKALLPRTHPPPRRVNFPGEFKCSPGIREEQPLDHLGRSAEGHYPERREPAPPSTRRSGTLGTPSFPFFAKVPPKNAPLRWPRGGSR